VDADDQTLVEEARRGSHASFRVLVERYQRRVYAMALSMLRDPDDARDVVQDAFVKAYRGLDGFQGEAGFYTWLYRIAMNLCIDRVRRSRRGPQVEFDETVAPEEEGDAGISPQRLGFDPARALADGEIRERVSAALEKLSPTHRAVLLLREVDGMAYKEIADSMGCSIGTVMSRLFHARKRMQEMLRPLVDGEEPPAGPAVTLSGPPVRGSRPDGDPPGRKKVNR
jgi:RNA polymerase sigma-70 factor (ECF subfamily)